MPSTLKPEKEKKITALYLVGRSIFARNNPCPRPFGFVHKIKTGALRYNRVLA